MKAVYREAVVPDGVKNALKTSMSAKGLLHKAIRISNMTFDERLENFISLGGVDIEDYLNHRPTTQIRMVFAQYVIKLYSKAPKK